MNPQPLTGLTFDEIRNHAVALGERPYRGDQLFGWIHQKRVSEFSAMTDVPQEFRTALERTTTLRSLTIAAESVSTDGTRKFAMRLADGLLVESVLIPAAVESDRLTLCLSTQVGCPLECAFCATGTMGFTRNLTSAEIVEQYLVAQDRSPDRISNIVYMGMGEPMLNYDTVMRSVAILTDPRGAGIGVRHITVSTAGYADKIRKLADEEHRVRLALSLHSLDDAVRTRIMPINRKHGVHELTEALEYYYAKTRRRPTLEYILFEGMNDSNKDIQRLMSFSRRVPSKVNLIPFHPIGFTNPGGLSAQLRPTPPDRIRTFAETLRQGGVTVMVRSSSGVDINAACGQLAVTTSAAPVTS